MTVQDLPLTGIDTGIVPLQSRQEPIPLTEQAKSHVSVLQSAANQCRP